MLGNSASLEPRPAQTPTGHLGPNWNWKVNPLQHFVGSAFDCKYCTFPVCNGMNSCTKDTKYATGKWLGMGGTEFTVVDTPGFGDSDNNDNDMIDEAS